MYVLGNSPKYSGYYTSPYDLSPERIPEKYGRSVKSAIGVIEQFGLQLNAFCNDALTMSETEKY